MQALTISRPTTTVIGRERPELSRSALAGAAGLAAAILTMVALLPGMAGTATLAPAGGPAPLPAPGPALVIER